MEIETRTHEQVYTGTNEARDAALAQAFPGFRLEPNCQCVDAGVIFKDTYKIFDEAISEHDSVAITCARCQSVFVALPIHAETPQIV